MIDLTGQRFGRLVVIRRDGSIKTNVAWICACACGSEVRMAANKLRGGRVKSCGCAHAEAARIRATTHGQSSTRLFRIWTGMKTRCNNSASVGWPNYGGRGITVCAPWRDSFARFAEWAVNSGYAEHLTIERIDVNGDYSPENCCWITRAAQQANKTVGRLADGRRLADVAREYGLKIGTVRERIRRGWPAELAATTPHVTRWNNPMRQH